jgi:hypothetical protein
VELTKVPKSGEEREKKREVERKKVPSRVAGDQRLPAGHGSQSVRLRAALSDYGLAPFFPFFCLKNKIKLVVWRWAWHFGRMDVQHPHFLKLALTLGRVKSSIPHGAWRFQFFFSNFG